MVTLETHEITHHGDAMNAQLARIPRSAIFDGKRLVTPSTCELHPKYQAIRPPRLGRPGCTCAEIYARSKNA